MEQGYEAASMKVIAERAELTKPGLYYHFKSKQDLLFAIMSHAMDFLEKETLAATVASTDNEQRLKKIIRGHARMIAQEGVGTFTVLVIDETHVLTPDDHRLITHRKRAYYEVIRATLNELGREGKLRAGTDTTVAAFSLLGMVMWISRWYSPDGALNPEEVAERISELALGAVLRDDCRTTRPSTE